MELGLEIYLPPFRGVVAKKGIPAGSVKAMAEAFRKGMETPARKKFAEEWYMRADSYQGPDEFGPWIATEVNTLDHFVKELGLKK